MPRRRKPVVVYEGKPRKGVPYEDGMAEFVENEPPGPHDYQVGVEEWPGENKAAPPRKRDR
ncbi:MAG: hypothetical protein J0H39_03820 [Alphaproteobacteria bacterium]|nr:hypothetical protein [Alphaproteobacteria bacterium]